MEGEYLIHAILQLVLLHQFNGLSSRTTWVIASTTTKVKPVWISMRQEMMGFRDGSSISWTICKESASCSRYNHTNTQSRNFYRPDALLDDQPTVSKLWRQITAYQNWNNNSEPQSTGDLASDLLLNYHKKYVTARHQIHDWLTFVKHYHIAIQPHFIQLPTTTGSLLQTDTECFRLGKHVHMHITHMDRHMHASTNGQTGWKYHGFGGWTGCTTAA